MADRFSCTIVARFDGVRLRRRMGWQMRIYRKVRPAADASEHRDQDAESPYMVRLGTIAEMVEGGSGVKQDTGTTLGRL
jgi:hypothetical protein